MNRLRLPFAAVFVLLLALAGRLFYIQVLQGVGYSRLAQKQFTRTLKEHSFRGDICDRNGQLLATTIESHSVYLHPQQISRSESTITRLAAALRMDRETLRKKIRSDKSFVWLLRKTSPALTEPLAAEEIEGLGVTSEERRYYPNGRLACHILGGVGMDNAGLAGVEQHFDSFLKGRTLEIAAVRDGKGRNITDGEDPPARLSNSLCLTIDRSLQYLAEKEIERGVRENDAKSGTLILQNPLTGEILALAAYPGFDPNLLAEGGGRRRELPASLANPALARLFEPGSTFKIVTFAAALEEKKFSPADRLNCEGGKWKFMDRTIRDHEPERSLTFAEVLEKSSNIGSAKIGLELGKETFFRYVRAFGFGSRTALPLPGETEGLCRHPREWSGSSLPTMAFGQEIGVNAIQLVNAFSAVANGGLLMEPQILRQMNDRSTGRTTVTRFPPQTVRRVISPETAATLRGLLEAAVEKGTGRQAKVPGYRTAGKTGTAQKIDPVTRQYDPEKTIASFCGFLPADKPRLVCLVLIDEPGKNDWGGLSAAPVFSRLMSRAAQSLGIPSEPEPVLTLARAAKVR